MDKVLVEELLKRMDAVAAKLGSASSALWPILVRQSIVSGWIDLCIGCGALSYVVWLLYHLPKVKELWESDDDSHNGFAFFGVALAVVMFIVLGIYIPAAIQQLLNPEYYALKYLVTIGH